MKRLLLVTSLFVIGTFLPIQASSILFHTQDFQSLQAEAQKQGKVFFVFFYGDNCIPCDMMKENTFTNPNIISEVNKNFIAARIRLDSQLGLNWQMNIESTVQYMPTIVFFSPTGKILNKYERWLIPSKFETVLQENLTSGNQFSRYRKSVTNHRSIVKNQGSKEYTVQLGAFKQLKGAEAYVKQMQAQSRQKNIRYVVDKQNGQLLFRVVAGKYQNVDDANKRIREMKSLGIKAQLKAL